MHYKPCKDLRSGAFVANLEDPGGVQANAFGCIDPGGEHVFAVQANKVGLGLRCGSLISEPQS